MKIKNEKKRRSWLTGWNCYFAGMSHTKMSETVVLFPSLDDAATLRGWWMAATIDFENDGNKGSFHRFCPYM